MGEKFCCKILSFLKSLIFKKDFLDFGPEKLLIFLHKIQSDFVSFLRFKGALKLLILRAHRKVI
jgi:hypothetical protein